VEEEVEGKGGSRLLGWRRGFWAEYGEFKNGKECYLMRN